MRKFVYWYAYFDSIFLKKQPVCKKTLATIIHSDNFGLNDESNCSPLEELEKCFHELKNFIVDEKNWSESICTIEELNKIEGDLTTVLILLEVEKLYIAHFWSSYRRIEASVAHLYAILQIFINAIIPYSSMTLFECKAANKLCVRISNLQVNHCFMKELVKTLMKKINPICAFFNQSFFQEENKILRNFFENFVAFMKSIPKIKKIKMFHVSDLLKYIVLTNSIEIVNFSNNCISNLRESFIEEKKELKGCNSCKNVFENNSYFHLISKTKRRYKSCPNKERETDSSEDLIDETHRTLKFIFPTWIRRHSIKHRKESIPHLQISPLKKKSNSEARKRAETPREYRNVDEKKDKIRNKSMTKVKTHKSSLSVENMSPSKFNGNRYQPLEKAIFEGILEENEENCCIQTHFEGAGTLNKRILSVTEISNKILNIEKMHINSKEDGKLSNFMKKYIIFKRMENIFQKDNQSIKGKEKEEEYLRIF